MKGIGATGGIWKGTLHLKGNPLTDAAIEHLSAFAQTGSINVEVDEPILKKIEEREEVEAKAGRGTQADLAEATMRCVEAEMDLHDAITFKSTPDLAPILRRLGELERKVAQLQKDRPPSGNPSR